MKIKSKDTEYVSSCQEFGVYFRDYLFRDNEGRDIIDGDTVCFYVPGNVFKSYGIVSSVNGLKINCFNTLLNKWQSYEVDNEL